MKLQQLNTRHKFIIVVFVMNKDEIIKNLCQQNENLQVQVKLWKNKYLKMQQAYQELLSQFMLKQTAVHPQKKQNNFIKEEQPSLEDIIFPKQPTSPILTQLSTKNNQTNPSVKNDTKIPPHKQVDIFDFFSENLLKVTPVDRSVCELIEGCFIIEKISSIDHFDPLRFIYPPNKFQKLRNMFDIIYRFIFIHEVIPQIQDDEFDSRKNEINFGTPCEDFQFVFDNIDDKSGEKNRLNQFQKASHLMRKRYIYGAIRPEIIKIDGKLFETQLAYGFISNVPFPNFFKDLNKIVQQQIKFRMLGMNKVVINKKEKVDIVSEIIKEITAKSIEKKLDVTSYPINLQLNAKICGLRLVYSSKSNFVSDQFNYIQGFMHRYSKLKLVKILHYILTEQHIIIICKNRKNLNQLFEVIRSFVYPFNWIFPIIYYYSPFFEPFLSSPLPIIIGFTQNNQKAESESKEQQKEIKELPANDFITIFAQQQQRLDLNQLPSFQNRINSLYKLIIKENKKNESSPNKTEKKLSPLLLNSIDQRLTYKFYNYIKKLRDFIQTGKINEQMDDFLIQFMESQMVSYYKENLLQQTSKK